MTWSENLRNHARMAANIRSLSRCRAIRSRLDERPGAPYRYGMASGAKGQNSGQSGDRKGDTARAARLKAALRENLRRRKLQVKGRAAGRTEVGPDTGQASHDSAGFVPDKAKD